MENRNKIISPHAIQALKDALYSIYWYKRDLRSFLTNCLSDNHVIFVTNWDSYKRQIVSDIIDFMCKDQQKYFGDLRRLFHEVSSMTNFYHLQKLDDGERKVLLAKQAVNALKKIVETHDKSSDEQNEVETRVKRENERQKQNRAFRDKLEDVKRRYLILVSTPDHHQRGFDLEKLLYDLFELFDLDPRASFRNAGEQIDGAFSLEGSDYLFEAKWQKQPTAIQDLDSFSSKVKRKLDNTLGLFLSINGFSKDAVIAHSSGRAVSILMTGADLMSVLEERIDFVTLLLRKRRHAAQTGEILYQIDEMIL